MSVVILSKDPTRVGQTDSLERHVEGSYIAPLDGLRALAVIAVLLCHAKLSVWFSGGFIGVDVFFVISGFVVVRSISRDQDAGVFSMPLFYARRLKRLVPALYCVLSATFVFGLLFCFPDTNYDILKNIGFVALFYSNIYLSKQTGYFDTTAENQPLLHTWSLSVEEQFYLILPLVLVATARVRPWLRIAILASAACASLGYAQYAVLHAVPGSYYVFQTRAFEFLAGVLITLALQASPQLRLAGAAQEASCLSGLVLIITAIVGFDASTPMPGAYALIPCIGAALVILGIDSSSAKRMLGNSVMVYIGKLSYVIYLWHWPVLFALRRFHLTQTSWSAAGLVLAIGLAVMTHCAIEQPLRRVHWGNKATFVILWVFPVCLIASLIVAAKKTDNFILFYSEAVQKDYANAGQSVFNSPYASKCWNKVAVTAEEDCTVGDINSPSKAVLLGDSHAYHFITFMDQLGKEKHLAIHDMTLSMCAPLLNSPVKSADPAFQETRVSCLTHNKAVFDYLKAHTDIRTVFLSAVWQIYSNSGTGPQVQPTIHGFMPGEIDRELADTIRAMHALGKRVALVNDIPILPEALESCVSDRLYLPAKAHSDCSYPKTFADERHAAAKKILDGVQLALPYTSVIHTYDVPCDRLKCYPEINGVPLYHHNDAGHLGVGGSAVYYRAYQAKHPNEIDQFLRQN